MWPVFAVQFNCEFLINDGEDSDVQLIFSFLHWFWAVLCVLWCVGKLRITHFRRLFYLVNVVHLIILFLHQFLTIIYVLGCVRKLGITPLGEHFSLLMWPLPVLQLNFDFWHIILADRSIYWPSFPLILGYFRIYFLSYCNILQLL